VTGVFDKSENDSGMQNFSCWGCHREICFYYKPWKTFAAICDHFRISFRSSLTQMRWYTRRDNFCLFAFLWNNRKSVILIFISFLRNNYGPKDIISKFFCYQFKLTETSPGDLLLKQAPSNSFTDNKILVYRNFIRKHWLHPILVHPIIIQLTFLNG